MDQLRRPYYSVVNILESRGQTRDAKVLPTREQLRRVLLSTSACRRTAIHSARLSVKITS